MAGSNVMKATNIRGKQYYPVNQRMLYFRSGFMDGAAQNWGIDTHIIESSDNHVVVKTEIRDETNRLRASGLAREEKTSSNINKTSMMENAETSAIGRALANLGIGIDEAYASADELAVAINQQKDNEIEQLKFQLQEALSSGQPRPVVTDDWVQYFIQSFEKCESADEAENLMNQFVGFSTDLEALRQESVEFANILANLKGETTLTLSLGAIATVQKAYRQCLSKISNSINYTNVLHNLLQAGQHGVILNLFKGKQNLFIPSHQKKIRDDLGLLGTLTAAGIDSNQALEVFPFLNEGVTA
jgi:hypothetical protein